MTETSSPDNMALGPDANLNYALSLLRKGVSAGEVTSEMTSIPPIGEIHSPPELIPSGQWRSPSGRLLELEISTSGTGSWLAMHLPIGPSNLSEAGFIGFACRSVAPSIEMIRPCIRSGHEDGFSDCFFEKHILAHPEASSHLDALHIASHRSIPEQATWRELVLFLPCHDFRWDIHDLRLFIL